MASEEEVKLAGEVVKKAVTVAMNDENGKGIHKEERDEMRAEQTQSNEEYRKAQQDKMAEIKAGITNDAAREHVSKLVKEITHLRKENVKKDFEIKMLQKNGDVLVEEVRQQIQEMKSYLVGVTGVFETFVNQIAGTLEKRETGLNESKGSNQEGRAESN